MRRETHITRLRHVGRQLPRNVDCSHSELSSVPSRESDYSGDIFAARTTAAPCRISNWRRVGQRGLQAFHNPLLTGQGRSISKFGRCVEKGFLAEALSNIDSRQESNAADRFNKSATRFDC